MSEYVMFINGGTTNTRFALLEDGQVIARVKRSVGVAHSQESGINEELEQAVRRTIEEFESADGVKIQSILASGMMTSNIGLIEIPHLEAPVSLDRLAAGVQVHYFPQIAENMPFYMVPGIRFHIDSPDLSRRDLMRGEETEIFGALSEKEQKQTIVFIHLGSHGKAVVYRNGMIQESVTTFGGELLWSTCHHTILQSSVSDLSDLDIVPASVEMGYEMCSRNGLTRTLFISRIADLTENLSSNQITSFIFGAVTRCDLECFLPLMDQDADQIIIYGRDNYVQSLLVCLNRFYPAYQKKVRTIPFTQSENLYIQGMGMIYERMQKK